MPRHTQTVKPHIALTLVDDVPDNIRLNLRGVDYVCEFIPIDGNEGDLAHEACVDPVKESTLREEDIAHEARIKVSEKETFWFVFNWNNKPGKMRLIHRVMINKTSWYENAHCPTQKTVSIYRT